MGIKGFLTYLRKMRLEGAIEVLEMEEIIRQIIEYRTEVGTPVIVINLWGFCNYFEAQPLQVLFRGRLNKIREEFETFLAQMKDAGAQLIFVFKKTPILSEPKWIDDRNDEYKKSLAFIDFLENRSTSELVDFFSSSWNCYYPLNTIVTNVLCQAAANYGEFYGNDIFLIEETSGHVELANVKNALAIIGMDTHYLCFDGPWKFWSPKRSGKTGLALEEYNKHVILDHFDFNFEEMQLFALLAGKMITSLPNKDIIANFFNVSKHTNFEAIAKFIKNLEFPLNRMKLKRIVNDIFKENDPTIVESLVDDFELSLNLFTTGRYENLDEFEDKEVNQIIKNMPMTLVENILHRRLLSCSSMYLDINATDMKPIAELVLPWIQKTMGLVLKNVNGKNTRKFMSPVNEALWEKIEIEPDYPNFEVPELKNLLVGDFSDSLKIKILRFLTNDVIGEDDYESIPIKFLIHTIILVHLVKNDSMEPLEACIFMQTIVDEENGNIPSIFMYPNSVNIRAFRLSALYANVYYKLASCMNSVGLKKFVADIKIDNGHFQNLYQQSHHNNGESGEIIDQIISIQK